MDIFTETIAKYLCNVYIPELKILVLNVRTGPDKLRKL